MPRIQHLRRSHSLGHASAGSASESEHLLIFHALGTSLLTLVQALSIALFEKVRY